MKRLLLVLTLALAGCASTGTKMDPSVTDKIHKGTTTKAEVIALLGAPAGTSLTSAGKEVMMWQYVHAQIKGATLIPIVGIFAGGSNVETTTLQVTLNGDKVVEDFLWNDAHTDVRMGH